MNRHPEGHLAIALWFAALFLVSQAPLYWVRYVDITDFANHLARLHVTQHLENQPLLQRFYVLQPGIAPNLALDAVVPALSRFLDPEASLKVFASLSTLLLATGAAALNFAIAGQVSALALVGLLFAQNAFFHLGLFNFVFGIGAAFWMLAAWVRTHDKLDWRKAALFTCGATFLYLCHLAALGVYAVAAVSVSFLRSDWTVPASRHLNRGGVAILQFVPAAFIHLLIYEPGTNLPAAALDESPLTIVAYKAVIFLLAPTLSVHHDPIIAAALVASGAILVLAGSRAGRIAFSPLGLRILIGVAIAMLALPPFGFGSNMVDVRLGLPLVLCGLASVRLLEPQGNSRRWLIAGVSCAVIVASAATLLKWRATEPLHEELRAAMQRFEPGSKVAVVSLPNRAGEVSISPHVAAWSVIDRSTFLSSFFIRPFQPFPIGYQSQYVPLARRARLDNDERSPPSLESLRGAFDFVVLFGANAETSRYSENATTLYSSGASRVIKP